MTRKEFLTHLVNIYPVAQAMLDSGTSLPTVCNNAALSCFMRKLPDNKGTEALRYQLNQLDKQGKFDFEDDK